MKTEHPITPPPELRQLWAQQAQRIDPRDPVAWQQHIATQAARWGADQELEACCEWLSHDCDLYRSTQPKRLRAARRPKPPSLKEQALEALKHAEEGWRPVPSDCEIIRRALESLPS